MRMKVQNESCRALAVVTGAEEMPPPAAVPAAHHQDAQEVGRAHVSACHQQTLAGAPPAHPRAPSAQVIQPFMVMRAVREQLPATIGAVAAFFGLAPALLRCLLSVKDRTIGTGGAASHYHPSTEVGGSATQALAERRRPTQERNCDILHKTAALHEERRQTRREEAAAAEMQVPRRRPASPTPALSLTYHEIDPACRDPSTVRPVIIVSTLGSLGQPPELLPTCASLEVHPGHRQGWPSCCTADLASAKHTCWGLTVAPVPERAGVHLQAPGVCQRPKAAPPHVRRLHRHRQCGRRTQPATRAAQWGRRPVNACARRQGTRRRRRRSPCHRDVVSGVPGCPLGGRAPAVPRRAAAAAGVYGH